jgi:hypothetical protein
VIVTDNLGNERTRLDADGLVDDAALFRVVADFHIPDQWKILAERVPDKSVVGEQAP